MCATQAGLIRTVNDFCSIVEREPFRMVGVRTHLDGESKSNTFQTARKHIREGALCLLADMLGAAPGYAGVCTSVEGAGNLDYTAGVVVEGTAALPEGLPERCAAVDCPGGLFARLAVEDRSAPADQDTGMGAQEYFIGQFRQDTAYVYDPGRCSYHEYAPDGRLMAIYNPVREPATDAERFASVSFEVVSLPDILCACRMTPLGSGIDAILEYFSVQGGVKRLPCARDHDHEYWGFPYERDVQTWSCFGSRLTGFDGVPDNVQRLTVPGGLCVHVKQAELNGDNPTMLYDVAFNHLGKLFLDARPDLEWDGARKVYARFRVGTSSSLFVPVRRR